MVIRKVFFSFHFKPDRWRVATVRGAGTVEGNEDITPNDWEKTIEGNASLTRAWIDGQMAESSCAVVLIGTRTATRPWVDYEIRRAWQTSLGVLGIHIHGLRDKFGQQSKKGPSPFLDMVVDGVDLSTFVPVHDPPHTSSEDIYSHIRDNLAPWVEEAIQARQAADRIGHNARQGGFVVTL
jgi:hypothetical protein